MKTLTRDKQNAMVLGVCSGIAKYLDTDPAFIRMLWIFGFLFAGVGILAYIIAAIIMPVEA